MQYFSSGLLYDCILIQRFCCQGRLKGKTMNPKNTLCLIVDIQERLLPALSGADEMLERCRLLIQGLTALDVPLP